MHVLILPVAVECHASRLYKYQPLLINREEVLAAYEHVQEWIIETLLEIQKQATEISQSPERSSEVVSPFSHREEAVYFRQTDSSQRP